MKKFVALIALLMTTLPVAACGGSGTQQSEQAAPPPETQATSTAQSAQRGENAQGSNEDAGLSVTTLEGKQVSLERQGEVRALYFMAGW